MKKVLLIVAAILLANAVSAQNYEKRTSWASAPD